MKMPEEKTSPVYKFIKWLVRVFYPCTSVEGIENLPFDPCIVVGNHAQMNGHIECELSFPGWHYAWCAGEMAEEEKRTLVGQGARCTLRTCHLCLHLLYKAALRHRYLCRSAHLSAGGNNRLRNTFTQKVPLSKMHINEKVFPSEGWACQCVDSPGLFCIWNRANSGDFWEPHRSDKFRDTAGRCKAYYL